MVMRMIGPAGTGTIKPPSFTGGAGLQDWSGLAGTLQVNPGFFYDLQEREHAVRLELDKRQAELEREIQGIKDDFSSRQDELNHQFQLQMAEQDQTLQAELQAKRISSAEYMQGRDLAQSEAEFARKLASQQLEADRQFQLQERQQQLDVVVEARQERLLQAQLAANPQDFVAYEFYKRNLGDPQDLALASKIQQASGGTVTGGASGTPSGTLSGTLSGTPSGTLSGTPSGTLSGTPSGTPSGTLSGTLSGTPSGTLSGTPFPDAPPAYDDETLRKVLSGLQNQGGQPLYNPRLGGTGVFGANIPSPNDISRSDANALTDSELGILSSFLRAGVQTGAGDSRVALDPQEFFAQTERSFVPTASGAGGFRTNYT